MRRFVLPVLALAFLLGACSSDAGSTADTLDDETTAVESNAPDSALPHFNWGDLAAEGSTVDDLRATVGSSNAAQQALGCV